MKSQINKFSKMAASKDSPSSCLFSVTIYRHDEIIAHVYNKDSCVYQESQKYNIVQEVCKPGGKKH